MDGKFSDLVQNAVDRSQAFVDSINTSMESAMGDLFNTIDTNGDGVISKDEFSGMSLSAWAMMRTFTSCANCLPELPSIKSIYEKMPVPGEFSQMALANLTDSLQKLENYHPFEGYSYFSMYLALLFTVHALLFLMENWRYMLGLRCTWRFKDLDSNKKVRKVDKIVGLTYDTPMKSYEFFKMVLFTVSGFALFRLIMAMISFVIGIFCINVANVVDKKSWRSFWMFWAYFWILGLLSFFGYYRINIDGVIASSEDAKILVGNHCCMIEVLVLYAISRGCAFVSAVENLGIPMFQGICQVSDALLVDRNDPESKKKTIVEVQRRARREAGSQLMMFPEGTLNNQQALFTFKNGAFAAGVPVQPIAFRVPYQHFNPCWTGEATGGLNLIDVLWRSLCQFVNRLEVKVLPVYTPSEKEQKDAELYASNVRDQIARALDIPTCDATYQDYMECLSKYTEALQGQKASKGKYDFSLVRKQMHDRQHLAMDALQSKLKSAQETARRMTREGPEAFASAHPEGLISNYEDNEGGYITRDGVTNLTKYKYQGGEYSTMDNLFNPFWAKAALWMPRSISPNAVTLTGFTAFFIGLLVALNDAIEGTKGPDARQHLAVNGSFFVQFFVAFCMFVYQTMDAIDGKHARNTGQSSPLGALFDHGCDACGMVIGALIVELGASNPDNDDDNQRLLHSLAFVLPLASFYFAQWEHYQVGILPTAGITETQVGMYSMVASWGISRRFLFSKVGDIMTLPESLDWLSSRMLIEGGELFVVCFAIAVLSGSVFRVVKSSGSIAPLGTLLPFMIHSLQFFFIFYSPCFKDYRILCMACVGCNFTDLAMRMIISGLCAIKYPFIHWPTIPFTVVSFGLYFLGINDTRCKTILISTLVWQILSVLWLASDTIARICSFLNIPFLAARPKPIEKKN